MTPTAVETEFDRQVGVLTELGYPALTGLGAPKFAAALEPLRGVVLADPECSADHGEDHVPFVLVVARTAQGGSLDAHEAMARTALGGRPGFSVLEPAELSRFRPVETVTIPDGVAYVLVNVDTGSEFLNVTPAAALESLTAMGRTPLTVEEGIALLTARPDMLRKNKCFSLLASRCGDKRVPALWISERRPKLGWCWNGNPHTWLGSASASARLPLAPA
ncbi:DUF5701 family protein [Rhodococcus tukisamuensis]|uniref:Uncharacterized protein n=1 Tax=Rhodococcus tukisamuensis TaxID=168276 RepID=A0A1G6MT30_9NOCA|nr:DUF5701 family protein [Rhodococcus tukisamuensis]SDC58394.1 hypothetical protein SAMN05444580_101292 [Rhodococcus tukisamuensis]